jgi:hypothetical protein
MGQKKSLKRRSSIMWEVGTRKRREVTKRN